MTPLRTALLFLLLANCPIPFANADPLLEDFQYPHPVQRFDFQSQGQSLTMAYMADGMAMRASWGDLHRVSAGDR